MKTKLIAAIIILMAFLNLSCQTNNKKVSTGITLQVAQYAGVYSYGASPEKGPTGQITIYPESDDSILFYIDISRGAPSYNMGNLYDRVTIKSNKGIYNVRYDENDNPCSFSFVFTSDKLTIKTENDGFDCGFGGNVSVDGVYYKVKNAKFDHFIDMTGTTYFFNKTKPEDYAKILK
jgi:hypothetical protein